MSTRPLRNDDGAVAVEFLPETTRAEALAMLRSAFKQAGVDTSELDARILLTEALQIERIEITVRPEVPLGSAGAARLADFARRRIAREPVGRILGHREFWGLPFELSGETLEPRPDTETVVETALAFVPDRQAPLRILDLGTGSGCLLIAILTELPNASGVGLDRAVRALAAARRNAARNGVASRAGFLASDWAAALRGRFDLIVSNPPYIASADVLALAPEVRGHDPAAALDGGRDGLAAYRTILVAAQELLAPDGILVVEIGSTQEQALKNLAGPARLSVVRVARDLAGHSRAVALKHVNAQELAGPEARPI